MALYPKSPSRPGLGAAVCIKRAGAPLLGPGVVLSGELAPEPRILRALCHRWGMIETRTHNDGRGRWFAYIFTHRPDGLLVDWVAATGATEEEALRSAQEAPEVRRFRREQGPDRDARAST